MPQTIAQIAPSAAPHAAFDFLNAAQKAEYWACLALRHTQGIGVRSASKLINHFGSAYAVVQSPRRWGEVGLAHKAPVLQTQAWREKAMPEWEAAHTVEARIILSTDSAYPPLLRQLPDFPSLLYTKGDISLLSQPGIAIVGTRRATPEGDLVAYRMGADFARAGLTVVSGMARGIDAEAHKGALTGIGSSVAVLGCGVDIVYPPEHAPLYQQLAAKGLIVSEFAPGTAPQASFFPIRNRIISGLSFGVVIVEAALKSGSLITASTALEQNRTVYAVPGAATSPLSSGCRHLVRQGAKVAFCAADIVEDLFPQLQAVLAQDYTNDPNELPSAEAAISTSVSFVSTLSSQQDLFSPQPQAPLSSQLPGKAARENALVRLLAQFPPASPQAEVFTTLLEHGPLHVDALMERLDASLPSSFSPSLHSSSSFSLDLGALSGLLVILETLGFVERLPAMVYKACV